MTNLPWPIPDCVCGCGPSLSSSTSFFFSLVDWKNQQTWQNPKGRIWHRAREDPPTQQTRFFTVLSWSVSTWMWNSKGSKGLVLVLFGLHNVIFCLQQHYLMTLCQADCCQTLRKTRLMLLCFVYRNDWVLSKVMEEQHHLKVHLHRVNKGLLVQFNLYCCHST